MRKRKKELACPNCGSKRLVYLPWLGQIYECKDCGYRGSLVIALLSGSKNTLHTNKRKKLIRKKQVERKGNPLYYEKSYRLLFPAYFKIYENRIEASFWPFGYEIPVSDVESVEIVERIPWYVGWGLRINPWKRKLYFAIHHGKSVKIKRKNGFWKEVVLAVKAPEKFVSVLRRLMDEKKFKRGPQKIS